MKQRKFYRAVFISDAHLGFRGCKAKQLLGFLKSIECETLYLVGDIFDLWAMKKKIWWDADCNAVVRRILKMAKQGTKIVYIPGNHDEAIRTFLPFHFGDNIVFINEVCHTTSIGEHYVVIHGDQFDVVVGHMKWLALLGTTLYDWLIVLNEVLHSIRVRLGYQSYWSLAGYLKAKTKKAISFVHDYKTAVLHHAKKNGCSGAICGHIHTAEIFDGGDGIYANCGDWVESLTALVENDQGKLELIYWHDMNDEGIHDEHLEDVKIPSETVLVTSL
jgi:UDP-2,3-diacylglucosamine pyrophosphatase LpxH